MFRRFVCCAVFVSGLVVSCGPSGERDAATGKSPQDETVLTIMAQFYTPGTRPLGVGKPLEGLRKVADDWENLHPGVRVQFALPPTIGAGDGEWIKTQLVGGIAPDIVSINVEVVWEDIDKGWWLNLEPYMAEPNPYVPGNKQWWDLFANLPLTKAKRAPDGNLYTVVLDMVETGIFYNCDLLKQYGMTPPKTWGEMRRQNEKIREAGKIPLVLFMDNIVDWGVDIVMDMIYADVTPLIDIVKASEEQEQYLHGYLFPEEVCRLYRKGWFTDRDPRWREVWRILKEWRVDWQRDILEEDRAGYFLTHRAAFYWEGSWFLARIQADPLTDFEWNVAYLPPLTPEDSPYATGAEAAVIGGAAMQFSVSGSAIQNGRAELAVDFLRFMTTPENTDRVVNEAGQFIPNIVGTPMQEGLRPFAEIIKRHYCLTKFLYTFDSQFNNDHKRWVHYFLEGGETLDEFMKRLTVYLGQAVDRYARRAGIDLSQPYDVPSPWELEEPSP
ncbi:MAG: ABC transporter substrate-binding protein [bacterium]